MAIPLQDQNVVGTRILPVTDLALKTSLTTSEEVLGTVFSTGFPATVIVLANLVSGANTTITAKADDTAANATANIGTPDMTMTLSATGVNYYGLLDTTANYTDLNAPSGDVFVQLKQTAASGGALFSKLQILCLYELRGGEDWYGIRHASLNAVGGINGLGNVGFAQNVTGFQDGKGNLYHTET